MTPVGQPPEDDDATPSDEASVVDPKVLAERRARRAEIAEESLLSRVNRAEQDRVVLATRLAEAEQELRRARGDHDELTAELARRERELRSAEQREFAEQQRRVEAEDEAVAARRSTRGDVDALRRQLAAAEQRVDELTDDLEKARREAAEAARNAAQERARAERRTAGGAERRALLGEQEKDLRRRVAEVERLEQQAREVSAKLDRRRESLETEIVALQSFADELDGTLRAERERRAALERELAGERERAAAEITLLQHELDRRTRERDDAAGERDRLVQTLDAVRAQLATARDAIADRDRLLAEAERLRAGAGDLEQRLVREREHWRAREEEFAVELEAQRRRHGDELLEREGALRTELELQRREFDRRVAELEAAAAGLRAQVLGAADELEVRVAAERAAKEAAVAALEEERTRLGEHRSLSMQEVAAEKDRLSEQRRTHEETAARERLELEAQRREADELVHRARTEAERTVSEEMRRAAAQLTEVREEARLARQEAAEASAARDALQEELRRRVELEHQVRDAITELRGRLADADAQDAARAERDAAVEALVTELVDTASTLRTGFEQELAETERRLRGQVEEERARFAGELEEMEERIGALRAQLGGAADELREQLEAERTARWAAESELSAERERHRDDRTLAADAARVQTELERELADRIRSEAAALEALQAVQEELDLVRATQADVAQAGLFASTDDASAPGGEEPEAPAVPHARFDTAGLDAETASLIGDLQAAADRLRAQVVASHSEAPEVDPAPVPVPADDPVLRELEEIAAGIVSAPQPAQPPEPEAPVADAAEAAEVVPASEPPVVADVPVAMPPEPVAASPEPVAAPEPEPVAAPEPEPQPVAPAAGAPGVLGAGTQVLTLRPASGPAAPWLAPALTGAATSDPALAARLLPAVLATHGRRSGRDLAYDLVIEGIDTWHVRIADGRATVDDREGGTGGDVDFIARGPLVSAIAFAAGGIGRRPGDLHVGGRKRRFRRLLKDLRAPVGLAEIAASGAPVRGLDLLRLLAAGLDPAELTGHLFAVDYDLGGAGVVHVAVDNGVTVDDGPAPQHAGTTVDLHERTLIALLAGAPPPPGERALVHGNVGAAELLHRWFDGVQGLSR